MIAQDTTRMQLMRRIYSLGKKGIVYSRLPRFRSVEYFCDLLKLSEFSRVSGLRQSRCLVDKPALERYVHDRIIGQEAIDYLEFGVFQGDSLKRWAAMNRNSESRFFGFDSFEGLPENWNTLPAGHFSTGGKLPAVDDARVQFIKGWFQDTLDKFVSTFQSRNRVVLTLDADLYTSMLYVLTTVHRYIVPGSVMILDDFGSANSVSRAYLDFASAFRKRFEVVGRTGRLYNCVAFKAI